MKTNTPCIGICSTVFGDQVCRGCKRFMHEVANWVSYEPEEKNLIWQRLESHMILAVRQVIMISNSALFKQKLDALKITYPADLDAHCWVIYLLRQTKQQLTDLTLFGLSIRQEYQSMNSAQLYELINEKWLTLSLAFYDLQINRAFDHYKNS